MSARRHRPFDDRPRPGQVFDPGLQHERTALAWERTAIGAVVAGILAARHAASSAYPATAAIGLAMVAFGAGLLVWTGVHYDDLHAPLRAGVSPVRPTAARRVGWAVIAFTAGALLVAVLATIDP